MSGPLVRRCGRPRGARRCEPRVRVRRTGATSRRAAAASPSTTCLPFSTLTRKLSRSRSPLASNETSISTPGSSFTEIFAPCSAAANALRVDLADLLGDRLDDVHAAVALEAVVVGLVLVLALELLVERLDPRQRRVGGEADVRDRAVGGVAGELDHLLAGERRSRRRSAWRSPACAARAARAPTPPRSCRRTARRRSTASPSAPRPRSRPGPDRSRCRRRP